MKHMVPPVVVPDREKKIQWLVRRKHIAASFPDATPEVKSAADRYAEELRTLPHSQLYALYDESHQEALKLAANAEDRAQEGHDQRRFFNEPRAQANFLNWAQRGMWSVEEGVALLLGKSPDVVTPDRMKTVDSKSPFLAKYNELYDIALSHAYPGGALGQQRMYPHVFLRWAERYDKPIPPELRAAVERYRGNLADWQDVADSHKKETETWKAAYEQVREASSHHENQLKEVINKLSDALNDSSGVIHSQRLRISALEAKLAELAGPEEKERDDDEPEEDVASSEPVKVKRMTPDGGDVLTRLVWSICYDIYEAGDPVTGMPVMTKLQAIASSDDPAVRGCLLSPTRGGVKWEPLSSDKNVDPELNMNGLRQRIRQWRNKTGLGR